MKKRLQGMMVVLGILTLCVTGCSAKKDEAVSMKSSVSMNGFTNDVAYNQKAVDDSGEYTSSYSDSMVETEEVAVEADVSETSDVVEGEYEQKRIRTVYMQVETEYFDDTVEELDALCERLNGYIGNSELYNTTSNRRYSIVMRIPKDQLDHFLDYTDTMGRMKIRNKTESSEDISLTYYDSYEHKKSLEIERDRILELIEKADSLEYVVALEDKLSELRYQINSYESQLRRMDSQVSYSTVTMDIYEVTQITVDEESTVGERIASGITESLIHIKEGFLNFVVWFVSNLPNLVLLSVVAFIAVKIGRRVYRKTKAKKQDETKKEEVNTNLHQ